MPRPKNEIPTYRRHRASGQAVVTLNGTDHYLGRWNSPESKAEYDRLINEWLVRGRQLPERRNDASPGDLLTKQLILGYYGHVVATVSDEEVEKVKIALKPVREMYGEIPAAKFGPVAFQAVRRTFIEAGHSINTIRDRTGIIKRMIAWGVANEMLPGDALYRLQAVPPLKSGRDGVKPSKKVLPVSDEHIDAVLPYLSRTVRAMVELQRLTGMRPGEICRITTGQIDRTTDPWIYRPVKHKTASRGKDRAIPLGPRAQELLASWLKANPDAPLFSPRESKEYHDTHRPLTGKSTPEQRAAWKRRYQKKAKKKRSTPREHEMYTARSYGMSVAEGCERAGVPVFRCNRIRHTYATHVRREHGLEAAQVLLGHSKADVTQIYAERDLAKASEVAKKIG
jgi:integrase